MLSRPFDEAIRAIADDRQEKPELLNFRLAATHRDSLCKADFGCMLGGRLFNSSGTAGPSLIPVWPSGVP